MGISKDEIIDLASRYISPEELTDFPFDGDLFCLLIRATPENEVLPDEEGWTFRGYGVCVGYTTDEESKPRGKWLWMHFASLDAFPPVTQVLRLQPPHVVKGRFQNPERTHEIRIFKVDLSNVPTILETKSQEVPEPVKKKATATPDKNLDKKIVQFRRKVKPETNSQ
jgi:hypothetical protein